MKLRSIVENEYAGLEDADEFEESGPYAEACSVCGEAFIVWPDVPFTCVQCGRTMCPRCEIGTEGPDHNNPSVAVCSRECLNKHLQRNQYPYGV